MLFSIIIPSYGRSESLKDCIASIEKQTVKDYEIITVTEEGNLAALRNHGARRAKGQYLVFIDDDVACNPRWLESIKICLEQGFSGVTGPCIINSQCRLRRDIFKYERFTRLFSSKYPGRLSVWGLHSMASAYEDCDYEGPVDYLEACNMAFTADAFWKVAGFDEAYGGVGEGCELDLCFRIRSTGGRLWFTQDAAVEHRPSQSGAYPKRLKTQSRMDNYELLSKRWIRPCWQHTTYKIMMRLYFYAKERGWI